MDGVLYYQGLSYIPEMVKMELNSIHYDDSIAGHFAINNTRESIARKYYWSIFRVDIKLYVKVCNMCLALKSVIHKPYGDLQSLPILTYQ